VVQKELFTFNDKGNRSITLRRSVFSLGCPSIWKIPFTTQELLPADYKSQLRYEKPLQAGLGASSVRCRVLGAEGAEADAEIIALGAEFLAGLA
jgi:histidyl-tRNA synthetase